jgi:hypothetical protein
VIWLACELMWTAVNLNRSSQILSKSSRFGYKFRENCPRMLRVSPGALPCGSSATWVSWAYTREPAHVCCAMVSLVSPTVMNYLLMLLSPLLRDLLPHLQPSEEGLLRREPTKVSGRSPDADCGCDGWYACRVLYNTLRCYQDEIAG